MAVPEFLWHCSRDSEAIGSDILEVLLTELAVMFEKRPELSAK